MKTCTIDGCVKAHRARGLCATHYNQTHQPERHAKVETLCDGCGTTILKEAQRRNRYTNLYCTMTCRTEHEWREVRAAKKQLTIYKPTPLWHKAMRTMRTSPPTQSFAWTAGTCVECGAQYVDRQPNTRHCSPACAKRRHRREWKVKTNRVIAPSTRTQVYARDNSVCQLCMQPVDMTLPPSHAWGPTLDHIVCQSWVLVPDHGAHNLRLAHRMCNSMRGDRVTAA